MSRRLALAVLALPLAAPLGAQPELGARDAAVAGVFAVGTLAAFRLDRTLAERLQRPTVQANRGLSRTATGFRLAAQPGVLVALPAAWAIGRLVDDRTTAAIGLHGGESVVLATGTVAVLKLALGRARPAVNPHDPSSWRFGRGLTDGEEYRSFPSGHTATAFAAASAVTAELAARRPGARWAAGVPLYASAAMVGWSRMYDNRHWASDAMAGAAIGTLSGLAVTRWHRRHPDNRLDRRLLGAVATLSSRGVRLAVVPGALVAR